jgi:hypothetical protein
MKLPDMVALRLEVRESDKKLKLLAWGQDAARPTATSFRAAANRMIEEMIELYGLEEESRDG